MVKISKTNKKVDETLSKHGSQIALIDERDETEARIVTAIRQRYSLSEELALHRKKAMGTVDATEWDEYCAFVESVVSENKN